MTPGGRILVVDDNIATCEVLVDALEVQGYQVQTAADGRQAWDLIRQNPTDYDLVLSDVNMPRMDGLELLARIRADAPGIQVILMTGHPHPAIPVQARRLGAVAVLLKPWGLEQLYQTLRRALSARVPGRLTTSA
jgi:CheY-like chemotaxis protein